MFWIICGPYLLVQGLGYVRPNYGPTTRIQLGAQHFTHRYMLEYTWKYAL